MAVASPSLHWGRTSKFTSTPPPSLTACGLSARDTECCTLLICHTDPVRSARGPPRHTDVCADKTMPRCCSFVGTGLRGGGQPLVLWRCKRLRMKRGVPKRPPDPREAARGMRGSRAPQSLCRPLTAPATPCPPTPCVPPPPPAPRGRRTCTSTAGHPTQEGAPLTVVTTAVSSGSPAQYTFESPTSQVKGQRAGGPGSQRLRGQCNGEMSTQCGHHRSDRPTHRARGRRLLTGGVLSGWVPVQGK